MVSRLRFSVPLLSLALTLPLAAAEPTKVTTTKVTRGDVIRYVTLPGTLKANQQATLYAKVAGYLTNVTIDKGDVVKADQVLAVIEGADERDPYCDFRIGLAQLPAKLRVAIPAQPVHMSARTRPYALWTRAAAEISLIFKPLRAN